MHTVKYTKMAGVEQTVNYMQMVSVEQTVNYMQMVSVPHCTLWTMRNRLEMNLVHTELYENG